MTSLQFLNSWIQSKVESERGASLVEYALLVALIAVVCIIAITFLGRTASEKFSEVGSAVDG
jgi:pilus assembly protein Flp/PilA